MRYFAKPTKRGLLKVWDEYGFLRGIVTAESLYNYAGIFCYES